MKTTRKLTTHLIGNHENGPTAYTLDIATDGSEAPEAHRVTVTAIAGLEHNEIMIRGMSLEDLERIVEAVRRATPCYIIEFICPDHGRHDGKRVRDDHVAPGYMHQTDACPKCEASK